MVLLKLAGALLIITSTTLLGFSLAYKKRERLKELGCLQMAFQMLISEISYTASPLPLAFEGIGEKIKEPVSQLFIKAAREMEKCRGDGMGEIWKEAVEDFLPHSSLRESDKEIILSVSSFLGVSDKVHQEKQLKLLMYQLKEIEKEARASLGRSERMCKYLGVLGGLMLVILLL